MWMIFFLMQKFDPSVHQCALEAGIAPLALALCFQCPPSFLALSFLSIEEGGALPVYGDLRE